MRGFVLLAPTAEHDRFDDVLGQIKTEEKFNEITTIPELPKLLSIAGCIVRINAMGCQKHIVAAIVEREAGYVLAPQGHQGR